MLVGGSKGAPTGLEDSDGVRDGGRDVLLDDVGTAIRGLAEAVGAVGWPKLNGIG